MNVILAIAALCHTSVSTTYEYATVWSVEHQVKCQVYFINCLKNKGWKQIPSSKKEELVLTANLVACMEERQ